MRIPTGTAGWSRSSLLTLPSRRPCSMLPATRRRCQPDDSRDRHKGEPGRRAEVSVSQYTSVTDTDREEMLATIGGASIEDLFADIPADLRLQQPLNLGAGLSEQEVYDEL